MKKRLVDEPLRKGKVNFNGWLAEKRADFSTRCHIWICEAVFSNYSIFFLTHHERPLAIRRSPDHFPRKREYKRTNEEKCGRRSPND